MSEPEVQARPGARRRERRRSEAGEGVPRRSGPTSRDRLLGALSSRAALRRAFLLREAFGPPVALREPPRDRTA
ncbi:MAG TPA: hypothetical protein VFZ79_17125 [Acidimicrobiales bacterium]